MSLGVAFLCGLSVFVEGALSGDGFVEVPCGVVEVSFELLVGVVFSDGVEVDVNAGELVEGGLVSH